MFEKNGNLCWALAESLDKVLESTRTNEEWNKYHFLRRCIKDIYGIEFCLSRYGLSGEILKHEPIIKEVKLSEVFDYLSES